MNVDKNYIIVFQRRFYQILVDILNAYDYELEARVSKSQYKKLLDNTRLLFREIIKHIGENDYVKSNYNDLLFRVCNKPNYFQT